RKKRKRNRAFRIADCGLGIGDCGLNDRIRNPKSAGRGVIASTETNSEPFLFHFYLDPAVTAVSRLIGRKIADIILAAQFLADLLERVFQFFHLERNKDSTACFLRKLLQDLVPLFARAHAEEAAAVDTDGVDYTF